MHISKLALLLFSTIVIFSILLAKISNVITVNYNPDYPIEKNANRSYQNANRMGPSSDHLLWFIQISDLHISIFHDPYRIQDFRDFCNKAIDAIQPAVVLASGDLADSKTKDNMGSTQFVEEWQYYYDILQETKVVERTTWLDIRGNHDNFNVPGVFSKESYFHKYSIQGKKHLRSYMYTIDRGTDKYSFIGVDACLEPGPRRPFNFIGSVSDDQYQMLQKFEQDSRSSNATIWFGHYPTSCIISPEPGLRYLMRNGMAYMCGHLHTLGGIVPHMYTLQHSGILELELGDWKENRLYRVAAVDNGVFSFTDVSHGTWPVILVTNPKHALFVIPGMEDTDIIKYSTHIRLLVFAPLPLDTVRLKINDGEWIKCENVKGPLYVVEWNPLSYESGINYIHVYAKDREGNQNEISHPFSMGGSRMYFSFLPRLALMSNAKTVFHAVFSTLVVICVLPLVILRMWHILVRDKHISLASLGMLITYSWFRKLWILSCVNKLLFPLIAYPIYVTFGPWFIGEVIEGHIGAAFAWGTLVDGKLLLIIISLLAGAFSYFYGCVQLFWFHIPYVLCISHCLDARFKAICVTKECKSQIWNHLPCATLLFVQAMFAYFFWLAYGTMALVLGPLRTWSVVLGLYLWYISSNVSQQDFHEACLVWGQKDYTPIADQDKRHDL